jgi:hypothetical protein
MDDPKSIFDDMPDEQPADPASPEEQKLEDKKPDNADGRKDSESDAIRNLEIAKKREQKRLEIAQQRAEELADIRRKRKEAERAIEEDEDNDEDEEGKSKKREPKITQAEAQQIVTDQLKKREDDAHDADVAQIIRKSVSKKVDAIAAFEIYKRIGRSPNANLDAETAINRLELERKYNRPNVAPSIPSGGPGMIDDYSNAGGEEEISKARIKHAERMGVTKDDIKKHEKGTDLRRLFPKVQVYNSED